MDLSWLWPLISSVIKNVNYSNNKKKVGNYTGTWGLIFCFTLFLRCRGVCLETRSGGCVPLIPVYSRSSLWRMNSVCVYKTDTSSSSHRPLRAVRRPRHPDHGSAWKQTVTTALVTGARSMHCRVSRCSEGRVSLHGRSLS